MVRPITLTWALRWLQLRALAGGVLTFTTKDTKVHKESFGNRVFV